MAEQSLKDAVGRWSGTNQLWLDPAKPADVSPGTITVAEGRVHYRWCFEKTPQYGTFNLAHRGGGVDAYWQDTWHQTRTLVCRGTVGAYPLLDVVGAYEAMDGPPWRWRAVLSLRPTDELILQMYNLAPWGEPSRAVRLLCTRI